MSRIDTTVPRAAEQTALRNPSVLIEAQALIDGDRNDDYGDYRLEAVKIAAAFRAVLGWDATAGDIPIAMILIKLIRQKNRPKRDNAVDTAGYAEWLERIRRATPPMDRDSTGPGGEPGEGGAA